MNTTEKNLAKKNMFRFMTLISTALIIVMTVNNCMEIKKHDQHVHIPSLKKKEIIPPKYKVRYLVTCPGGIDAQINIKIPDHYHSSTTRIIEFRRKCYPPKLQTEYEYEFEVYPPFDVKILCFAYCEDISISVYINDDLVESQKVRNNYYSELFWQLVL